MNRKNSLPVDNFRRFVPVSGSIYTLIILNFLFQEVFTWTKVVLYTLAIVIVTIYFYVLYKRIKVEKATVNDKGIEIRYRSNRILIDFKKIRSINKVINYGFNFKLKYSNSYVVYFNEKFPFGSSISFVYPISENEPQEITELKGKWTESIKNNNSDQP